MNTVAIIGVALGMRHGADPDHLAAIDGLTRIRPRASNGVYFALGHALVMIILAVGMGRLVAGRFAFMGPWSLILLGSVNLLGLLVVRTSFSLINTSSLLNDFCWGCCSRLLMELTGGKRSFILQLMLSATIAT